MIVEYIDDHRERFGVDPICRVLTEHGMAIAPSTYYARKKARHSLRSSPGRGLRRQRSVRGLRAEPPCLRGSQALARDVARQARRWVAIKWPD